MTTKTEMTTSLFDPWPDAGPLRRPTPDDPETPPATWYLLPPALRARLGGLVVQLLAEHGEASRERVAALVRVALRGTWQAAAEGAFGPAERAVAEPFFARDPEERLAWRTLEDTLATPAVGAFLIQEVVTKLRSAGDLETTLRQRRDALDAQLARVRALRGPAAAATAGRGR